MQKKFGFTLIKADEFESWLASQSISRVCARVQQHHTWKPRYSGFNGKNHFEMQRAMKRYHINDRGWSDIGQHFSIFPDGVVLTGRPLNRSPACIGNANSGAICIENVGNFNKGGDTMNDAQANAIFLVTASLLKKIGIRIPTRSNVVYHHWYNSRGSLVYHNSEQKSCPGTAFFGGNQLSDFEKNFLPRLQQAMGDGGVPPRGLIQWATVNTDSLKVRTGPSSSASLSNQHSAIPYGSVIRIYEEASNGWKRISQTKQLWVYGRFVDAVTPAMVNTPDTNARIGPGMDFDIARVLQDGDKVFVSAENGAWRSITEDLWIHESPP